MSNHKPLGQCGQGGDLDDIVRAMTTDILKGLDEGMYPFLQNKQFCDHCKAHAVFHILAGVAAPLLVIYHAKCAGTNHLGSTQEEIQKSLAVSSSEAKNDLVKFLYNYFDAELPY